MAYSQTMRSLALLSVALLLACSDDAAPGEPSGLTTGNAGQAGTSQAGSGGASVGGSAGDGAGQAGVAGQGGSAPDPAWQCVGSVPKPKASTPKITIKLPLRDMTTGLPAAGVTVRSCAPLDVACLNPYADDAVTDSAGVATLEIFAQPQVAVSFQLVGSGTVAASVVYPHPTSLVDGATLPPVRTFVPGAMKAAAEAAGVSYDATRGSIIVDVRDCNAGQGVGVTLAAPDKAADTVTFYGRAGAFSKTATNTDASGLGGFLLVPTGAQTVASTRGGQALPDRKVYVGADLITYAFVSPTP